MNAHGRPIFLRPLKCLWTGGPVKVSSSPEPGLRRPPEALEYEAGHILVFFPPYCVGVGAELQASRQLQDSHPRKGNPLPQAQQRDAYSTLFGTLRKADPVPPPAG